MKKILTAIALLASAGASAQFVPPANPKKSYLIAGIGFGEVTPKDMGKFGNGIALEIGGGRIHRLGENVPLRAEVFYGDYSSDSGDTDVNVYGFGVQVSAGYTFNSQFTPYIGLGSGAMRSSIETPAVEEKSNFSFLKPFVVFGFEVITLDKQVALAIEQRYMEVDIKGYNFNNRATSAKVDSTVFKIRYEL
ncbi:MAG: porin family protein [Rickettsiales bacterium]|jgi:opacity protein-like surface antigen|nr:porin family protein [Rickettsiales bacterium]